MLRILVLLFLFFAVLQAATVDYIMAFKPPVTDKTYKLAKKDIIAAKGEVLYEYKAALKGLLVRLPTQEITAFCKKPYVDFLEPDHSVHIK